MKRIDYFLIFICCCNIYFCNAQSKITQDSLLALDYYKIANDSSHNVPLCYKYNELAKPLLLKTGQYEKYIYILLGNSYCYKQMGNWTAWEENNLFAIKEAKRLFSESHPTYSIALNNLGDFYRLSKEDYSKAQDLFLTALNAFHQKEDGISMLAKAGIYQNLGYVSKASGDFDSAINFFDHSYSHFERGFKLTETDITSTFRLISVLKNKAEVFINQQKYDDAILLLLSSLKKLKPFPDSGKKYVFAIQRLLVKCYIEKQEIGKALSFLKQINATKYKNHSTVLELQAKIAFSQNNLTEAKKSILQALAKTQKSKYIKQNELYIILAQIERKEKKYTDAEQTLNKALNVLQFKNKTDSNNEEIKFNQRFRSLANVIKTMLLRAEILQDQYSQSKNIQHLESALKNYRLASQLTDRLRKEYQTEKSKLLLNSKAVNFYENAILISKQLFELTKEEQHIASGFYFMEKNKASLLLEEVRQKELNGKSLIPDRALKKLNQFRIDLNYYQKILTRKKTQPNNDSENLQIIKDTIFTIQQNQRLYKEDLKRKYTTHFSIKDQLPIDLASIQKLAAKNNQIFLEYFIGQTKSYAIKIESSDIRFIEINKPEEIQLLIKKLLNSKKMETAKLMDQFTITAFDLYKKLLAPMNLSNNKSIIIIPDNILGLIPFEILITQDNKGKLPKEMDFMIRHHLLNYAFSATSFQLQNQKINSPLRALGVFPIFNNSSMFLPDTEKEKNSLNQIEADFLNSANASISELQNNINKYNLLHFSTHAVASDSILNQPAIYLYDSLLYLSDLYTYNLTAELVVLSACETGLGVQHNGEGIMSLARGFAYAGIPSSISSLWRVNDASSSELIYSFYKNLKTEMPKHEALHQAKLEYLSQCDDIHSAPHYWAGFIQLGNIQPFQKASNSNYFFYWFLFTLVIFSFLTFYFLKRKKI